MMTMDSVKLSGFVILFVGVGVLLFTLANAYMLLTDVQDILGSQDLINLFGEALAPLISYAIRALYLGIMGWIGSILTRRGVQIITSIPQGVAIKTEAEKETKEAEDVKVTERAGEKEKRKASSD